MTLPDKALAWAAQMRATLASERRVIAFAGAGVSMGLPANVPGWRQCFLRLCDVAADEFGKHQVAERARRVAELTGYQPRYLTVAFDDLRRELGDPTYHRTMQSILEPQSRTASPRVIAQLVRLPFWAYMTTDRKSVV